MVLHTLNALPDTAAFRDCLSLLAAEDALLLLGDASYAALPDSAACKQLQNCPAPVYVLAEDAAARGLAEQLWNGVQRIDMDGFVELSERFARQQAWY